MDIANGPLWLAAFVDMAGAGMEMDDYFIKTAGIRDCRCHRSDFVGRVGFVKYHKIDWFSCGDRVFGRLDVAECYLGVLRHLLDTYAGMGDGASFPRCRRIEHVASKSFFCTSWGFCDVEEGGSS